MNKLFFQVKKDYYILTGALTIHTVSRIWQFSKSILENDNASLLTFNLKKVTQSDSSGVALLIAWTRMLKRRDQKVHFVALPEQMFAIIRVSDLEEILPIKTHDDSCK